MSLKKRQPVGKHRICLVKLLMVFNFRVKSREQPGREEPGSRNGPLPGIGVDPDFSFFRTIILREQSFPLQPDPEILSHACFQDAAAYRQLACRGCPGKPFMRCEFSGALILSDQGGPNIVPAEHNNPIKRIAVVGQRIRRHIYGIRICLRLTYLIQLI